VTLGLALGALALFYFLFLPKPTPEEAGPALPVSTELRADGYQAAWRWLKSEGIPVVALHERYDRLLTGNLTRSRTGNILLTTLPHKLPARLGEVTQLDQWVEGGNTLIVMAALDDTPRWALMNKRLLNRLRKFIILSTFSITPLAACVSGFSAAQRSALHNFVFGSNRIASI